MAEHLQAYPVAVRPADIPGLDGAAYLRHLLHVQLACENHHVGELSVEFHGLDVAYIHLCGDVDLLADLPGVEDRRHIGGDYRADAALLSAADNGAHKFHISVVYHGVYGKICLYTTLRAEGGYLSHVVGGEVGA